MRPLMVFLVALALAYAAYWYVYGRERDLTELEDIGRDLLAKVADTKRLSDLNNRRRQDQLDAALDGRLSLTPNSSGGSTLSGTVVSREEDWIINRAYVHIRILEKRHCGEKLENRFSDINWEKNCASDPTHSIMDTVADQSYQCFVGKVGFGETARCYAEIVRSFDPTKQSWDFFFSKVTGHPKDPLGIFD